MAVLSATDISAQMVAQLRLLSPTASGEVGTPERLILDTAALRMADMQIDLTGLSAALDVGSKFGANLDNFVGLFGFKRVQATPAIGFAQFSRVSPAVAVVTIPTGTALLSQPDSAGHQVQFATTTTGTILVGQMTSDLVPIQAASPGVAGNVSAGVITIITTPGSIPGVSSVTNPAATAQGADAEDDNSLKVRFHNTVFRNMAGTRDQFLALAIATAFTTKANVVGPVSTYQEYVQVPLYDDAGYSPGTTNPQPQTAGPDQRANGLKGQYTTALSTIPYASAIYTALPTFVSTGPSGSGALFLRESTDFVLNSPALMSGDTYREGAAPNENLEPFDTGQPNVTFLNVFTGTSGDVTAATPEGTYLLEYSYQSSASRNDIQHNVTNAVDVFVDGTNPQQATVVFPPPSSSIATFTDDPASPYYIENFRRLGSQDLGIGPSSPVSRPLVGHFFTPLFHAPLLALPDSIAVGDNIYTLGTHYALVRDVSEIGGSTRARDGVEWSSSIPGVSASGSANLIDGSPNGWGANDVVTVGGYTYDQNIQDLQAALQGARQVTTDLLAHLPRRRYFKLDLTVVYAPGSTQSAVNLAVQQALQTYFATQYFGAIIRLSDLLQIVHGIAGVQNVRWTNDFPSNAGTNFSRVIETDEFGTPLLGTSIERLQIGATLPEINQLFVNGTPQGGSFTITSAFGTTAPIPVTAIDNQTVLLAANIQTAINAIPGQPLVTVQQDARVVVAGVRDPILSYTITFNFAGAPEPIPRSTSTFTTASSFINGQYIYDWDFFLRDDELPQLSPGAALSDTLAGVILRPRAENTWILPPVTSGLILD